MQDAFDTPQPEVRWLADGSALVDGLTHVEEINQVFKLSLRDVYYTTIGGLVMGRLDRVPVAGDELVLRDHGVRLRVESVDGLRVAQLRISRTSPTKVSDDKASKDR